MPINLCHTADFRYGRWGASLHPIDVPLCTSFFIFAPGNPKMIIFRLNMLVAMIFITASGISVQYSFVSRAPGKWSYIFLRRFPPCNLRRASATDALTSGRLAEQNGRPPDNPNSVLQLDHHDIMLGDPLEDCVSRYCIVHDHGLPFVWFPLGTDDRAPWQLNPLFQNFQQDFDLPLIGDCIQQEVVNDQKMEIQDFPYPAFVFCVVSLLKCDKPWKELIAAVITDTVFFTCSYSDCFVPLLAQ